MRLIWLALVAAVLAGCGSGGGTAAGNAVQSVTTTATVGLSTQSAGSTNVLYAVQFTLHLPAGVTLPADATSGEVPAGVLLPVDSAALAGARYQPASGGNLASVRINIVDPGGFAVGDLATLACSVTPGATASATGFSLDGFTSWVWDTGTNSATVISGISPHFTVKTQ
jgi:hypothetical protein